MGCLLVAAPGLRAQSSFQNLDFEGAQGPFTLHPHDPTLSASEALPAWTVRIGVRQEDRVVYGGLPAPGSSVGLTDTNWPSPFPVLQGLYSVSMGVGDDLRPQFKFPVSVAQTGLVPAEALRLLFLSRSGTDAGQLAVTFGGTLLPFALLEELPAGAARYWADISAWAGQSGELRFTTLPPASGMNYVELDDIQFVSVPEPSVCLLVLTGLGVGAWAWRWKGKRNAMPLLRS